MEKMVKEVASIRKVLGVVLLLVLGGMAHALTYEQGIHLIRPNSKYISDNYYLPEYLSVEDLIFISCLEEEDVALRPSVMCLDNNNFEDLEPFRWDDGGHNCYVSSFNLDGFDCTNIRLQAEYTLDGENLRLTKDIRVNKLSKVLDKIIETQYSDGGWRTTKDTAFGIWGLSHFHEIFGDEMEHALSWLELERNNALKCFPKSPCNVPLSLEILYTLTLSGYDDARRVVNDARNWIENLQNFFEQGDEFSVEIKVFVPNASFVLASLNDQVLGTNFSIRNDTKKKFRFAVHTNDTLYVVSPENFEATIRNTYGELVHTYVGNNLSYTFEGACWSANRRGEPCNTKMTAYAAQLDLHEKNLREARRYMFSRVNYSEDVGAYYGLSNDSMETSLFLKLMHNMTDYPVYKDSLLRYGYLSEKEQYERYIDDLKNWLLFRQNNEGSWGKENSSVADKALPTAFAVDALLAMGLNRTFEPVEDAERWMSDHEDKISSNDTVALGSAFFILRNNARPLLVVNPAVIEIKDPATSLEIYNPTAFSLVDLGFNVSKELADFLEVEEKDVISAYSYRKINIKRKSSPVKDIYGFLEISNLGDPVARVPVVMTDFPTVNVTAADSVTLFGTKGKISLNVRKSAHEFICSMDWDSPEISSPSSFRLSQKSGLQVSFSDAVTKEDLYKGTLVCKARKQEFKMPISVYITRYSSYPISVNPSSVFVNKTGQNIVFFVKNNLDIDLAPEIVFNGNREYFQVPESISLNPGEEKNITVRNLVPEGVNYTSSESIQIKALGKAEAVSVVVDITAKEQDSMSMFVLFTIFVSVFLFLSGLAYLMYRYRDQLLTYINKFNIVKTKHELKESLDKLEQVRYNERKLSIVNMLQLLKFQKRSDEEIKKIMLENFSKEELKRVTEKENITIKGLDEDEPEQVKR